MNEVTLALEAIHERIALAERTYGRPAGSVTLIAVSKTHPVEAVAEAVAAGQRAFGENQLQDAMTKIPNLRQPGLEWHFIGPVQSNKTRAVATHFQWVHSVDRLKIARRLSEQRPRELPALNICLEVNISEESTKSGVLIDDALTLAQDVAQLSGLRLRGLMAIPAPTEGLENQRKALRPLVELYHRIRDTGLEMDTLSMGMTDDLEAAIAEGATMVRVGTAIFGPRRRPTP